jgi:hypothetical protein
MLALATDKDVLSDAAHTLSLHRSQDLLTAVSSVLEDPHFSGRRIAALGSRVLGLSISYQGDSTVYIADRDDPDDTAQRAILSLETSLALSKAQGKR